MKFGEKVRNLRKGKYMSQAELAERIGVSSRTVISYETGKSYPKQREIYADLAKILGCEQNYLMTEDETFVADAAAQYGYRGKKQAEQLVGELGGMFAGGELSEEDKDAVMRALQEAYWKAKEENRQKYTPKKYREM